jgi:hypothetical protein
MCSVSIRRAAVAAGLFGLLATGSECPVRGDSVTSPASPAFVSVKRVVVWDGEQATNGGGWTNPKTSKIGPQSVEAHSGKTALEFRFNGSNEWLGAGWNWFCFKTGTNVGTDASAMKNLTFWIKTKGKGGALQLNLLCNGDVLDTPEEHTAKVQVRKYCPRLLDGDWHEVVIPLADLTPAAGFNPRIISEIHFGFMAEPGTDGSFILDDIAFDDRTGDQPPAAAQSASFSWSSDCSGEDTLVNSHHPTIPGHYEYLPDPKEPGRGLVFAGHLTPDFTTTDAESFHLHPDIYFDRFLPGNIIVSFDVKVDDLTPSELGPYRDSAWLNVVTLFDETTRAGGTNFHPSVMVNLVGTPGHYTLQGYSIGSAGKGTVFYDRLKDAPVFPTGKWVTVRVEVDIKTRQACVYQDNAPASAGPYLGGPGLAGAHMGLYANRKITQATVFNDNITITVGD